MEAVWQLPSALQELVDAGCHDLLPELIETFTSDAAVRLATARAAAANGDLALLQRQMHTMKGSALQMGAARLADLCKEIELGGPAVPGERQMAELSAVFDATERAMTEYLAHL